MTRALMMTAMLVVVATILTASPHAGQQALGANQARHGDVSQQDEDFVKNALSGGILEVNLGRHAAKHAHSQKVREFGQTMVRDHTRIGTQLKSLAKEAGINFPSQMEKQDTDKETKLITREGKEFDTDYMKQMVLDHQEDIKEFQEEADKGKNHAIMDFAKSTLPTLKEHLQMAEKVQGELKGEK